MKLLDSPVYVTSVGLILYLLTNGLGALAQKIDLLHQLPPITYHDTVVEGYKPVAQNMFYPSSEDEPDSLDVPQPYTGVPFRINAKYEGLNGEYKIVIRADDSPYLTVTEPYCEFTPVFGRDEGKLFSFRIWYRPTPKDRYVLLRRAFATAKAPPFNVELSKVVVEDEEITFNVWYGFERGQIMPPCDSLHVTSEGNYFLPIALRLWDPISIRRVNIIDRIGQEYELAALGHPADSEPTFTFVVKPRPEDKYRLDKPGFIRILISDPMTGQSVSRIVRVIKDCSPLYR